MSERGSRRSSVRDSEPSGRDTGRSTGRRERATSASIAKLKRTVEQIRELLTAEQDQVFMTYLEYDTDLNGRMSHGEFRRMIKAFNPNISGSQVDAQVS